MEMKDEFAPKDDQIAEKANVSNEKPTSSNKENQIPAVAADASGMEIDQIKESPSKLSADNS